MKSGKLTHIIYIERAGNGEPDRYGVIDTGWTRAATLRAELVQSGTAEFIRAYGAADEETIVFRTRYLAGVTTADRISFDGRLFNIKSVSTIGRNRGLEMTGIAT